MVASDEIELMHCECDELCMCELSVNARTIGFVTVFVPD